MPSYSSRILELRRRVQSDPAPFVFAQLAEEYRRSGNLKEAAKCCRDSLARYPTYVSARVTLARVLTELEELDDAAREYTHVLENVPDNLAATRSLAEIHERHGEIEIALQWLAKARRLAPEDETIVEAIEKLERRMTSGQRSIGHTTSQPAMPYDGDPPLVDLDGVLSQLGAPDHAPPPLTERLISATGPETMPTLPELTAAPLGDLQAPDDDALAILENDLREYERARTGTPVLSAEPPPAEAENASETLEIELPPEADDESRILEELEAWLAALAPRNPNPES